MAKLALMALAALLAVSQVSAIMLPCNPDATPARPSKARIVSQVPDPKTGRIKVTLGFDTNTNSNTGCILSFTISMKDAAGKAVGAKISREATAAKELTHTMSLMPNTRFTWNSIEVASPKGRKNGATVNLTFVTSGLTLPTGRPEPRAGRKML